MFKKIIPSIFIASLMATSSFAQQQTPQNSGALVDSRNFDFLMNLPNPKIYQTPEGWENAETIPEPYKKLILFIKNVYKTEPFIFWQGDEEEVTIAVAPYEYYTPYSDIIEQKMIQKNEKAAKRLFITEHYFKVSKISEDEIRFEATLPKRITNEILIPWIWGVSSDLTLKEVERSVGVWNNKLGLLTSGKLKLRDIHQKTLADKKNLIRIDNFLLDGTQIKSEKGEDFLSVKYEFGVEDLKYYDPGNEELLPTIDVESGSSILIFKNINKNTSGPIMKSLVGINDNSFSSYKLDENNLPIESILFSLDLNDAVLRVPKQIGYGEEEVSEEERSILEEIDNKLKFSNVALRAEITGLNTKEFNIKSQFLINRTPERFSEDKMLELALAPNIVQFGISNDTPLDTKTFYQVILDSNKKNGQLNKIYDSLLGAAMESNSRIEFTDINIENSFWGSITGSGNVLFDPIDIGKGFMLKTKLIGDQKLNFFNELVAEGNIPEPIRYLSKILDVAKNEDDSNYNLEFKITDREPISLNEQNITDLLLGLSYDFLVGDINYSGRDGEVNQEPGMEKPIQLRD
jgi:hypothetical protein